MESELTGKNIAAGGCEVDIADFGNLPSGGCGTMTQFPEFYTPRADDTKGETLFDYGANLKLTEDEVELIPEVEVIPDMAIYLGSVYIDKNSRIVRIYRVNDEVVRSKPGDGIEG